MDHYDCSQEDAIHDIRENIRDMRVEIKEMRADVKSLMAFRYQIGGIAIAVATILSLFGTKIGALISKWI